MRIGILTDSMDRERTGIGVYVRNLLEKILEIDEGNDYYLIHRLKNVNDEIKSIYSMRKEVIISLPRIEPKWMLWIYVKLPYMLRKLELDILHDPSVPKISVLYSDLFTKKCKKILTIHDLTPLFFSYHDKYDRLNLKFLRFFRKEIDAIIVPSISTKNDVIRYLKISEDKIKVIPYGRDERFKVIKDERILSKVSKHYKLPTKFILYVGNIEPRKNIEGILKAYYRLRKKQLSKEYKLILVGKPWKGYSKVFNLSRKLKLQKDVIFTNYIDNKDMPIIYNLAECLVYPSFYEGFGLPPLEAMACGCPVVVSNTSSLPEVVGDAGIKVDPCNINEIADAIYEILINDDLKHELVKRGLKRAKLFSWEKAAKETLKVYEGV